MGIRPLSKTYGVWNPVPEQMVQEIVSYYLAGNSTVETGKKFGITSGGVDKILKRNGHNTRGMKYKTGNKEEKIIACYLSGKTAPETAKEFGIGSTRVYEILQENGIKKRYTMKGRGKKTGGKENLIIEFYISCKSVPETAIRFGINKTTVYEVLRNANIAPGIRGVKGEKHHLWKGGISANGKYSSNRCKIDPLFKLIKVLRGRISSAIKKSGYRKKGKTGEILGADYSFVRGYLEAQFRDGMTWENHGKIWEIDHSIPLASAQTEEELMKLFHYTNLQPLYSQENKKKWAKLNWEREKVCH